MNTKNTNLYYVGIILGHQGKFMHGGSYKISIPYPNMMTEVDGFRLSPAMELECELLFIPTDKETLLMGEICLFASEVAAVEHMLIKSGFHITAIHNHFIRETKPLIFIHFKGLGHAHKLATSLKPIIDHVSKLRKAIVNIPPRNENALPSSSISFIEKTLGIQGKIHHGVYKIEIERPDLIIRDHGVFLDADSWFTLQGSAQRAALAGEVALKKEQVQPFIAALAKHNIEIAALHNHMITEEPRIFFVHPWATGTIEKLVQGIKEALETLS
jgi:hypothetical protein